jgi:type I restriction enzyme S subunit
MVREIGRVETGTTPSKAKAEYYGNDYPFYKPNDLNTGYYTKESKDGLSKKGIQKSRFLPAKSVLVTCIGATIGKTGLIRIEGASNQQINAIIPYNGILPEFVYWECISKQFQKCIFEIASATTLPILNKKKFELLPFLLPPLPEQQRIVAKIEELFTKLDAGVEALKKIKTQLKRYRQAVLKYAFEGKLTEEWRKVNKPKEEIASPSVRNDNLPEPPEGWIWTRVGQIADNIHYGYTESATQERVGPKFLRITDIQNNSVNWDLVPYCNIDNELKEKYLLKEGDLVFARTGATVGKSFLIVGNIPESIFASYLIRIILNDKINKKFVYNFFQSLQYWMQISKGKLGIGQPNVNAQILSQITFPLAPVLEQHKIVEEIERRFSVADEIEKVVDSSLKQSERLRQSILKRAFEGKLVNQDSTEEPADKLLERIKTEKAKRIDDINKSRKTRLPRPPKRDSQ